MIGKEGFPVLKNKIETRRKEQLVTECFSHTVESAMHPGRNEDSVVLDLEHRLFGVLDGMGGCEKGEVASGLASAYISSHIQQISDGMTISEAEDILWRITREADSVINLERIRASIVGEMGTTASIIKFHVDEKGKKWAIVGNIGDSRVYRITKDGKLEQCTTDDDLVSEEENMRQEEKDTITRRLASVRNRSELKRGESYFFENRHVIIRFLGDGMGDAHVFSISVARGDRFLISSDGIHDNLTFEEIEEIMSKSKSLKEAIQNLINIAISCSKNLMEMRSKLDDMSAVVVRIK